ncbi:MAG: hypothetical protein NTZ39_11760 [Methanoregula sp.]|nr:hypothetical protein [Methanoregula sp.]
MTIQGRRETDGVTISKDEYDSMNRMNTVLSDENIMAQIRKGKQKDVRSRFFEEVAKELEI